MKFADKILNLRKSRGMSQEELAEQLNVSRQAISRWEMGTAQPDVQNVLQISKLFGVTTDYLLHDDYESDQELPCVKEVRDELKETTAEHGKGLLFSGCMWLVAGFCFLIAFILNPNILMIINVFLDVMLAGINFNRYRKIKK